MGGLKKNLENGKSWGVGGSYVKFPPWWGYGYFLELHNLYISRNSAYGCNGVYNKVSIYLIWERVLEGDLGIVITLGLICKHFIKCLQSGRLASHQHDFARLLLYYSVTFFLFFFFFLSFFLFFLYTCEDQPISLLLKLLVKTQTMDDQNPISPYNKIFNTRYTDR